MGFTKEVVPDGSCLMKKRRPLPKREVCKKSCCLTLPRGFYRYKWKLGPLFFPSICIDSYGLYDRRTLSLVWKKREGGERRDDSIKFSKCVKDSLSTIQPLVYTKHPPSYPPTKTDKGVSMSTSYFYPIFTNESRTPFYPL